MSSTDDGFDWLREMHGRQLAVEVLLTRLVWQFCRAADQPAAAMADLFDPVEASLAAMAADPGSDRLAMETARSSVHQIRSALDRALAEELRDRRRDGEARAAQGFSLGTA